MSRSYQNSSRGQGNRALRAATSAVVIIIILLIVCVVELVVLAVLNAKLRAQNKLPENSDTVVTTAAPGDITPSPSESTAPSNPVGTVPNAAYLAETADYGQEYIDKIVFVGDSTTYGMKSKIYAVLTGGTETKQVWTPESGTLSLDPNIAQTPIYNPNTGTNMTISEAAAQAKPEYMVITLGLNNGVPFLGEDQFKQCYRKLIDSVIAASPSTKLILQSIYPVATNNTKETITNEKIDRANGWIADLALEYKLKYLNTNPTLKDTDGYLFYSYQNGDGIHFNKIGFEAVLKYIRTHGYPAS